VEHQLNAKTVTLSAVLLTAAVALTGCDASGNSTAATARKPPATAAAGRVSPTRIDLGAADGQRNASVHRAAHVSVAGGRLTGVTLTAGGQHVPGTLSADARSWQPDTDLHPGTTYRLTAQAANDGGKAGRSATFTTLAESRRFTGTYSPENGSTVGVGMPVSFTFDKAITDRQAVAGGIQVSSSSGQPVVGHWFGTHRLDFRPEDYWKAGTAVTVRIQLDGVRGADGAYGVQDKTVHFTIGRKQVSTVDVHTDTMKVVRGGQVVKTLPITSGAPGKTTYNGQMVISQKLISTRMDGATVGYAGQYDIPDVPHAMRLSASGTFIHGNYWADDSVFGHSDVSHGCIGLNDVRGSADPGQDAAWFYRNSLIGDVVVVKNSHDTTIAPDNGLNGWNMPWEQWKARSA
jgi:lipoprotein-anchoring transpeptidase ErfK/SrfK